MQIFYIIQLGLLYLYNVNSSCFTGTDVKGGQECYNKLNIYDNYEYNACCFIYKGSELNDKTLGKCYKILKEDYYYNYKYAEQPLTNVTYLNDVYNISCQTRFDITECSKKISPLEKTECNKDIDSKKNNTCCYYEYNKIQKCFYYGGIYKGEWNQTGIYIYCDAFNMPKYEKIIFILFIIATLILI